MQNSGMSRAGKMSTWAVMAACWGVGGGTMLGLGGCEKMESAGRQGDRTVDKSLADSESARAKGGEKSKAEVMKDLQAAAGVSDASNAGKARGKGELAREELNLAQAEIPDLSRRTLQIEQALWDLRQAAGQVRATQRSNADAAKLEPKESLAKLEENRAAIKKSLDKAKADGDAAKAELDKRQKEIDGLKAERATSETEAESLADKSAAAKGAESVELFKKSTDARIKAGTLAAQIEVKTAALLPYQRRVTIAQQQQQIWDSANKDTPGAMQDLDDRKAQLDAGWQGTQTQIQAMNDVAKKVVAGVITPKDDGKQPNAAAKYVNLVKENEAERKTVIERLTSAIKHYGEAAAAAKNLHTDLSTRVNDVIAKNPAAPELAVWKNLMALYDENTFKLQQGIAQGALADVYAAQALELAHRKYTLDQVSQALQASGMQMPAELVVPDPATAVKDADTTYQSAESTLEGITTSSSNIDNAKATKDAALISLLLTRYGRFQITLDDKEKEQLKLGLNSARESNLDLPPSLRNLKL